MCGRPSTRWGTAPTLHVFLQHSVASSAPVLYPRGSHAARRTQTMLEAPGPLLEAESAKHCRRQLPLDTRVIGDAPNLYG